VCFAFRHGLQTLENNKALAVVFGAPDKRVRLVVEILHQQIKESLASMDLNMTKIVSFTGKMLFLVPTIK